MLSADTDVRYAYFIRGNKNRDPGDVYKWKTSGQFSTELCKIGNPEERQLYIQGAANDLMEKWEDLLEDQELEVTFFIRGQFRF